MFSHPLFLSQVFSIVLPFPSHCLFVLFCLFHAAAYFPIQAYNLKLHRSCLSYMFLLPKYSSLVQPHRAKQTLLLSAAVKVRNSNTLT